MAIPTDIQKAANQPTGVSPASKPEWCPEDIWVAAVRRARTAENMPKAIARAIMAEREACAVRAEALDRTGREWVSDSLWANIKADTAAAIRTPTTGA